VGNSVADNDIVILARAPPGRKEPPRATVIATLSMVRQKNAAPVRRGD
jgi:hypothetical protein